MPDVASITPITNDMQFFANFAALGTLIQESGFVTAVGTICSYTPASGKTFTFYRGNMSTDNLDCTIEVRNNGTAIETRELATSSIVANNEVVEFVLKGDQMAGNGSNTYDIYNSANGGSVPIEAAFQGYIQ